MYMQLYCSHVRVSTNNTNNVGYYELANALNTDNQFNISHTLNEGYVN